MIASENSLFSKKAQFEIESIILVTKSLVKDSVIHQVIVLVLEECKLLSKCGGEETILAIGSVNTETRILVKIQLLVFFAQYLEKNPTSHQA